MKGNFQTILIAVFLAFAVFAVMVFSGLLPIGSKASSTTPQGKVVVWGTFPNTEIIKVLQDLEGVDTGLKINYVQKSKDTYQQDLIESFANGDGPDIFVITPDMILRNQNFIFTTPFASYPEKTFRDSFIDGADIFLTADGVTAFPLVVDPMVVYYNKDILSNNGVAKMPEYWDELFNLNKSLTIKKDNGIISQSMIGLGRFDNVTHAKDILSMLLIQSGNPLIERDSGRILPVFDSTFSLPTSPAESVLSFFTEFSNSSLQAYSWNRTLPQSKDFFTGSKLAFYLGKASELFDIETINPNLSFDVSTMFQTKGTNTKRTLGDIYALALNKKSTNFTAAYAVSQLLTTGNNAKNMAISLSLPPASRTLLEDKPTDAYMYSFYNSAIISRSWLDPNPAQTDLIFSELIENILSNKLSISDAINKVQNQFALLVQQ